MKIGRILALIFVFYTVSFSQNTFEFMRIDNSARAGALAGTFTANTDDPNVIFYNPAGLNLVENNSISFSYTGYLESIKLASLAYTSEIKDLFKYGAAIKYAGYGTMTEADEYGNKLGDFSANEFALILGAGSTLDQNFYYGGNAKFIYSKIADKSSTAIAVDLGLNYYVPDELLSLGFSVLNLGTQLSTYMDTKEDLPLDIAVGVSKKMAHLPLRLSLDFHRLNKERDNFIDKFRAFTLGAEFTLSKALSLRIGYDNERRKDLKVGTFSGISGFNGGLGLKVSNYTFDYGFSSMGLIGTIHRISIATNL
ncbi:MAG: type IX secretion system protein PorQ [Bacteroidota bacterium]|nr:type IX secretion system protein PorQ [Bacteroidota bacterium]